MEGLAEYYSVELGQKIKRGMHDTALKCKFTGSVIPLGYSIDKEKHFQIDPETAPIVKTVFDLYIKGTNNMTICDYLNSRGFRTALGKPFSKSSVNRMIQNRKYIGEYKYSDVVIKDGIPPIISSEVFSLAQREMEKRTRRRAPK